MPRRPQPVSEPASQPPSERASDPIRRAAEAASARRVRLGRLVRVDSRKADGRALHLYERKPPP